MDCTVQKVKPRLITSFFFKQDPSKAAATEEEARCQGYTHAEGGPRGEQDEEDEEKETACKWKIREVLVKVERVRYFGYNLEEGCKSPNQVEKSQVEGSSIEVETVRDGPKKKQEEDTNNETKVKESVTELIVSCLEVRDEEGFLDMTKLTEEFRSVENRMICKKLVTDILDVVEETAAQNEEVCLEHIFNFEKRLSQEG